MILRALFLRAIMRAATINSAPTSGAKVMKLSQGWWMPSVIIALPLPG